MPASKNDDVYLEEDKSSRFSLSWLKSTKGKVIALVAAIVVVGGGTAIAGVAGAKVAHQLPTENAHHHFFNPNIYGGYGYYPTGPKGTNLVWGKLPFRRRSKPDANGRPGGAPLGPANPQSAPGGPTSAPHPQQQPPKHKKN